MENKESRSKKMSDPERERNKEYFKKYYCKVKNC